MFSILCEDRICPSTHFFCGAGECIEGGPFKNRRSITTACKSERDVCDLRKMTPPCALFYQEHCSEFWCNDKGKCLSHHRLSDGYDDCSNGEDEQQTNACSLDLPYRFQCDNGTRCISQILVNDFQVRLPCSVFLEARDVLSDPLDFEHSERYLLTCNDTVCS